MASKVFENNARHLVIMSDDGVYKMVAVRRAIKTERSGTVRFTGSYWTLETFRRDGDGFKPVLFEGLPSRFDRKEEIVGVLSTSVRFTQAYKELSA